MARLLRRVERLFKLPDLRILGVMLAGVAVSGIVDGSLWRSLLTPTIAYRPAVLFGLMLVFGWRGFLWSQLLFLFTFVAFLGWRGAMLVAPLFVASNAAALLVARRLARKEPWLLRERSTLAFLAGALVAPALPALVDGAVLPNLGIALRAGIPNTVEGWLRGSAGILAVAPALLVYLSGPLKEWTGLPAESERQPPMIRRNLVELGFEVVLWTATLWITVQFKARYGLNVTYLTFVPPLALALLRGMGPATVALAVNAVIATTLWYQMHWEEALSAGDLRLLIAIYSTTILVLAAVVDERQRSRMQVDKLRTAEAVLLESERHFRTLANSAPVMIWMTGPDKLCTFVNKPWLDFTGQTLEQELGTGWLNGVHPDDVGRCRAAYDSAHDARGNYLIESRFRRSDGQYRWVLDQGIPLYRDGRFAGYIGCCVDITEQRLAADRLRKSEEAARENEQRLNSIYNTVRDGIFCLAVEPGEHYRFVSVNEAFMGVTGLNPLAVIGKPVTEVIPEPSLSLVLEKYRQAIEQRAVVVWEETTDYPTGRLTGEVSVAPVFDDQGLCTHLVGSGHDITERKRADQKFQGLLEAAPDAMVVIDWEGRIILVNDRVEKLFGYQREELWGKSIEILVPERFRGKHLRHRRNFLQEHKAREMGVGLELYGLHKDGREFPVEVGLSPLETQEGTLVTSAIRDITERKRAGAALRESEERLKHAERLAHMGHWNWDIKTNAVHLSEGSFRILGQPEDFPPAPPAIFEMIAPQDRGRAQQWIRDSLAAKKGGSIELEVKRPNGEPRNLSLTSEILLDENGRPRRLFGSCQDITDSKRAQEQTSVRQRLESVGTLAGGIAHDFNNLLGAVLAQAELALDECAAGSSPEEEVKAIREVAMRGSEIVRELMIYSGKESEALAPVDVSRVVDEMLGLLKISISKHAALKTDLGQSLPAVRASAAQISQLVMNLATNASEAIGDRDGVISITTQHVIAGQDSRQVDGLAEGEYIQLDVSDTGCGMSAEMQARVFDPFFSTKSAGRGLGLAVVHGIVRGLGGAIHLSSEPGRGTMFRVMLPCDKTAAEVKHESISEAGHPGKRSQSGIILMVEDEDPLREAVSKLLGKHGFSVIKAPDGSCALDVIRGPNHPIHVLFLDITLPGASGRDVLHEARRLRPDMRVIVTSAYTEEMAAQSLESTIQQFLRKPYRFEDLLRMIQTTPS